VLRDVTNISCANSYKSCTAATKLQVPTYSTYYSILL
jgi:hypothetical protein